MKLPEQVVCIWYKAQVRYSLGSDITKTCAALYNWKELEENSVVRNRAERLSLLWRASSGDCTSFCLVIQHFQLCKSQKVSDHTHPYEVFGYDMTKGKAGAVSRGVRNPMRTHVHQDPLIIKPVQKTYIWGGEEGKAAGLRRNDQNFLFKPQTCFLYQL